MDRGRRMSQNNNGNNNGRHPHSRREFYRSCGNQPMDGGYKNNSYKPQISTWKVLRTRLEDLTAEKTKCLSELQKREEEAMKSHNTRHTELLSSERESIREKAKDRESLKVKEEEFKTEQKEKLVLIEELKQTLMTNDETRSSKDSKISTVLRELGDKEEELRLEKDKILESFLVLETQFTTQEKKLTKEIFEERESLSREKSELMEKFATRERNLDLEIQVFCGDVERQLAEVDKKYRLDSALIRNKMLEREVLQRDQAMHHVHSYVAELEERSMLQIQEIQSLDSECQYHKAQLLQQLESDKSFIIAKAKCDGIMEYLQGGWQHFDAYPSVPNEFNYASEQESQTSSSEVPFTYSSQDGVPQPQSPCFKIPKQPNGAILTDLRDRYEDLKTKASGRENQDEKFNWTLSMIRKIVSYYESIGMRVYEESSANKYTSTLIWCPNDHLYPNKLEASFAMGHGDSEEEATENAAQLAFFNIQCYAKNNMDEDYVLNPTMQQVSDLRTALRTGSGTSISSTTIRPDECQNKNNLTNNFAGSISSISLNQSLSLESSAIIASTPIEKEIPLKEQLGS